MIKFGIDIGNSAIKGKWLNENNEIKHTIFAPSAINRMKSEAHLTFASPTDRYVQVLDSRLSHFKDIVAIGDKAIDLPDYQQFDVSSTSYKANNEITTALLFGSIAEKIDINISHPVDVILALSIPIVESKTVNVKENYEALLTGTHVIRVFTKDGHSDITLNVVSASVKNEGQAGFLGLLDTVDTQFADTMSDVYVSLNESSNPIPTLEDFLVVDIGEGTTDLAVFRGKRFNPEYSYSITKGYGNLLENAMATAERDGLTIESRKTLQDTLNTTNPRRQERKQRWEQYVIPEKAAFIDEVASTILKTYGRQDYFDAIIFLGGGFSAITGYTVMDGHIIQSDSTLLNKVKSVLDHNHKEVGLLFGVPAPYAQTINERGLTQILSAQNF